MDVNIVDTVVESCATMPVPTPVEYMKGIMDLRGRVVPVIDLRKKFGLPRSEDANLGCVIVFTVDDGGERSLTVGALVDEVSEVLSIGEASLEAARVDGTDLWEKYVSGIVRFEERMIVIIQADGLFSIREIEALRAA